MALFGFGKKKETPAPASAPAATPVSASTPKPGDDLTSEERYAKGMELFKARDYDGAFPLLKRACPYMGSRKDKYPDGQAAMGWMYENGQGTEAKDSTAYLHYRIAAKNGNQDGMAGMVRLAAKKDVPSVDECQKALDYIKQLGTDEAKSLLPTVERQLAEAQKREKLKELDLTEENVQAIFNRCMAKEGTPDDKCFKGILFSSLRGYSLDVERIVVFDKEKVQADKQNIRYLYGQLKNVHERKVNLQINDAFITYFGGNWTTNKGILLEFLYLGAMNDGEALISIFDSKANNSTKLHPNIKPTLSPKDPAFPAWWEEHKAEWEQ